MDIGTLNTIFYDDRVFEKETIRYVDDVNGAIKTVDVMYIPKNKQYWEIITDSNERESIVLNQTRIIDGMHCRAGQSKSGLWYVSLVDYESERTA